MKILFLYSSSTNLVGDVLFALQSKENFLGLSIEEETGGLMDDEELEDGEFCAEATGKIHRLVARRSEGSFSSKHFLLIWWSVYVRT